MKMRIMAIMAACLMMAGAAHAELKDNGNGTITDTDQGLVWLKNADCFGSQNWPTATLKAKNLASGQCGLTDKSAAGQWRLPTTDELFRRAGNLRGFSNVQVNGYWSSSSSPPGFPWVVGDGGYLFNANMTDFYFGWPVRARQQGN